MIMFYVFLVFLGLLGMFGTFLGCDKLPSYWCGGSMVLVGTLLMVLESFRKP